MENKELCKRCVYAGTVGSRCGDDGSISCDYVIVAKRSAIGKRGDDPDECLLFEEGERIERKKPETIHKTVKNIDKWRLY